MKLILEEKLKSLWQCVSHEEIVEAIVLSIDEEEREDVIEQAIESMDVYHNPNY